MNLLGVCVRLNALGDKGRSQSGPEIGTFRHRMVLERCFNASPDTGPTSGLPLVGGGRPARAAAEPRNSVRCS